MHWPRKDINQYDVAIKPEAEVKRQFIKAIWDSDGLKAFRAQQGGTWLFDGQKLAW